jgi:acetoacetyl-CoA synthetase
VPQFVIPVPEIPVTINGKKVEAAVKQTLGGKDVVASNTVLNPEVSCSLLLMVLCLPVGNVC